MGKFGPDWLKTFRPKVQKHLFHEQRSEEDQLSFSSEEILEIISFCFSEKSVTNRRLRKKLQQALDQGMLQELENDLRDELKIFPQEDIRFLQDYLNEPELFSNHVTPPKILQMKNRLRQELEKRYSSKP